MNLEIATWVGTSIATSTVTNLAFIKLFLKEDYEHPFWIVLVYSIIIICTFSFLTYIATFNLLIIALVIICNMLPLGFQLYFIRKRGKKAILKSVEISDFLHIVDLQLVQVLYSSLNTSDMAENLEGIEKAIDYLIHKLANLLSLHQINNSLISVMLVNDDGTFTVLSTYNISMESRKMMERKFRHKDNCSGVAGYAVQINDCVIIPDLAKDDTAAGKKWIPLRMGEKKMGIIACSPVRKGVFPLDDSEKKREVMAVVTIASPKPYSFNCAAIRSLLIQVCTKVEIALYSCDCAVNGRGQTGPSLN